MLQHVLPLFDRELVSLANRRRTYYVRVLYCAILIVSFLTISYNSVFARHSSFGDVSNLLSIAGSGEWLFQFLIIFQYAGMLALTPLLMAGAITGEKERECLALLFLTDLKPWNIVLEKYASGLLPVLSFQFLTLPVSAVVYSVGGLSVSLLLFHVSMIFGLTFLVGAMSLMYSSYCRRTASSMMVSYLTIVLVGGLLGLIGKKVFAGFPAYGYVALITSGSLLFLLLARYFLVRRAFVSDRDVGMLLLKQVDRMFDFINDRLLGGVILFEEKTTLPQSEPIAWRENRRRSIGKKRHMIRVLLLEMVPVIFLGLLFYSFRSLQFVPIEDMAIWAVYLLWIYVMVMAVNAGSSAIAMEKSHQTLEVLLTTPLYGRDIIFQKISPIRRGVWVMMAPVVVFHVVFAMFFADESYVVYSFVLMPLLFLAYCELLIWLSCWIGLKTQTRLQALGISLFVVIVMQLVPLAGGPLEFYLIYELITGKSVFFFKDFTGAYVFYKFVSLGLYLVWASVLKRSCRQNSDRLLGRSMVPGDRSFVLTMLVTIAALAFLLVLIATGWFPYFLAATIIASPFVVFGWIRYRQRKQERLGRR